MMMMTNEEIAFLSTTLIAIFIVVLLLIVLIYRLNETKNEIKDQCKFSSFSSLLNHKKKLHQN